MNASPTTPTTACRRSKRRRKPLGSLIQQQNSDIMEEILCFTGFVDFMQLGRTCKQLRQFVAQVCIAAGRDQLLCGLHTMDCPALHTQTVITMWSPVYDITEGDHSAMNLLTLSTLAHFPQKCVRIRQFDGDDNKARVALVAKLISAARNIKCVIIESGTVLMGRQLRISCSELQLIACTFKNLRMGSARSLMKIRIWQNFSNLGLENMFRTYPPNLEILQLESRYSWYMGDNTISLHENVCRSLGNLRKLCVYATDVTGLQHLQHLKKLETLELQIRSLSLAELHEIARSGSQLHSLSLRLYTEPSFVCWEITEDRFSFLRALFLDVGIDGTKASFIPALGKLKEFGLRLAKLDANNTIRDYNKRFATLVGLETLVVYTEKLVFEEILSLLSSIAQLPSQPCVQLNMRNTNQFYLLKEELHRRAPHLKVERDDQSTFRNEYR